MRRASHHHRQRQRRVCHDGHDGHDAAPTRTKTLQVGGLVAVSSALQFAAAAAVGLMLFGSAIVFCALLVGGYYFVWSAHDDIHDVHDYSHGVKETRSARKDLARLERGLGRAHNGAALGGSGLLARLMLRQLVAAGDRLAALRRSVLGFSFTVSLADSTPVAMELMPAERDRVEITVIPVATEAQAALIAPTNGSLPLPTHLKLLPASGGKENMTKKRPKKSRRRSKPKDLVTFFTSNLARDTPIKAVQRVAMPPVALSITELMALKPAPSPPVAPMPAASMPVTKQLHKSSVDAALPSKTKLAAANDDVASKLKPLVVAEVKIEQHVVSHVETVKEQIDMRVETIKEKTIIRVEEPESEMEPVEKPEWELPPVVPRKVTLYDKPAPVVVVESPVEVVEVPVIIEQKPAVEIRRTVSEDSEDFLFSIAVDPSTAVEPAEWTRLKPAASSMGNAELREMVEELDAMSREADTALAACSELLASFNA